jgi:hypothetical protein
MQYHRKITGFFPGSGLLLSYLSSDKYLGASIFKAKIELIKTTCILLEKC